MAVAKGTKRNTIDTTGYTRLTADKLNTEGLINLLEAYVKSASDEYINALDVFVHHPHDKYAKHTYEFVRKSILSKHFSRMTNLDGNDIVSRLDAAYMRGYRVMV